MSSHSMGGRPVLTVIQDQSRKMNGRKQEQKPRNCYHICGRIVLPNRAQRTKSESIRPPQQQEQRPPRENVPSKQLPGPWSSDRRDAPKIVQVSDDRFLTAKLEEDGYVLGSTVGRGATGNVRVATKVASNVDHATTARRVACKVINKLQRDVDGVVPSTYVRKFLPRELDVLRTIRHPHVIHTHQIYVAPSSVLVFMDYCEMGDLSDHLRNVRFMPQWQVHLFFKQICEAVDYLHENGIVHRDIKCENILLENSQHVKLTDFGLARTCTYEWNRRVRSRTFCGTVPYTSPEVLQGIPYDPKVSDVWAMGVVLYNMLAGCMPFPQEYRRGIVANQKAINLNKPWRPITRVAQSLVSIILEPDPKRRATVKEIRQHTWVKSTPYRPHKIIKR